MFRKMKREGSRPRQKESPWVYQIVLVLNCPRVCNRLLHPFSVPTFKLRSSFNYTKQRTKELVTIKVDMTKLKR